ncbi:GGDEF domain-containing protein [Halarsenatibacter silvermanii]|uniref:Diguanylate cyclase (GGDEF) domain-containing protein n=1 Tax=Halarsenatibacter silvermanii TaxID=321763 RepID=A0A1G9SJW5_9FIRM|nr:GGDEF domain-containing protein [Halarsenatibacter silvermanii]SDM35768.1 diguanylate cyclase (GGDEF) domain-containing protein [Halarsenatibacter silvermanii]
MSMKKLIEFFLPEINIILEDLTDEMICFFDGGGEIIAANNAFAQNFLRREKTPFDRNFFELLTERYKDKVDLPAEDQYKRQRLKFTVKNGTPFFSDSIIFHRKDKFLFLGKSGSPSDEEALKEISKLNNELANKTRQLAKKNAELERTRAEMERIIRTDELTGLANRRAFREFAGKMLAQAQRYYWDVSFVMMDLDNFKEINDKFGHKVGDEVLKSLGKVLLNNVRDGDIVARIGGEEFGILLMEAAGEEAEKFAERIREEIKDMNVGYEDLSHTVSMGVTQFRDKDDLDELMIRADRALYKAKNAGKDVVKRM